MVLGDVEEVHSATEVDPETGEAIVKTVKRTIEMLFLRGDVRVTRRPVALPQRARALAHPPDDHCTCPRPPTRADGCPCHAAHEDNMIAALGGTRLVGSRESRLVCARILNPVPFGCLLSLYVSR